MAVLGFNVTFERYFPHDEGDDVCEPDESGFVIEGASLRDALAEIAMRPEYARASEADESPVREPRTFYFERWNDCTRENIEQGVSESRALHIPDSVTRASRRRIARFLGLTVAP